MAKRYRNMKGELVEYSQLTPEDRKWMDEKRMEQYRASRSRAFQKYHGMEVGFKTEGAKKASETKALHRAEVQLQQARQKSADEEFRTGYRNLINLQDEETLEGRIQSAREKMGFSRYAGNHPTLPQAAKVEQDLRETETGRACDARCKNSKTPTSACQCACNGENHGKGT